MKVLPQPRILNSKGQPIVLNARQKGHAEYMQKQVDERFKNDLGYQVDITTLTTVLAKITEQKFYHIAFAQYLPVKVGEGKWSSSLTTYRTFQLGDDFESGIINSGSPNSKLASVNTGVDALNIKVINWAKELGWSIFDLEQAAMSGNWDIVTSLEKSRKTNWDLGLQKVAFLGAQGLNDADGPCLGLLNQPSVAVNNAIITKPIKSMTPAELSQLCELLYAGYRDNSQRTAQPTHFIIPESDYNGLAAQSSPDFPIKSKLQVLLEAMQTITNNPQFQIKPLSYADASYHQGVDGIDGKQVYTLLNYEEESLRMNIPCDYTNTLANSLNNFNFNNAAYGQFTGVLALRPREMLYLQFDA